MTGSGWSRATTNENAMTAVGAKGHELKAPISFSRGTQTVLGKLNIHSLLQHAIVRMTTVWYIKADQKV